MAEEEMFKNNDINKKLDNLLDYLKETNKTNKIQIDNINKRLDKLEHKINNEKNNENALFSDKKELNRPINHNDNNISSSVNLESNVEDENSKIDIKNNKQSKKNNNKAKNNNIRGTYMKTKDKSEFLKNIQYLMIKNNEQIWKYSISNYNKSSNSAYYYCSDTSCKGKGTYSFNDEIKSEFEKKIGNKEPFQLTKEHSIEYSQHNYVINEETIGDLKKFDIEQIKNKLTNYKYLQIFIKKFAIINNDKCTSSSKLYNLLIEQFGNFEINYDDISTEEKELIIEKYRKRKKLENSDNLNIKDVLNLKNICISGYIHLKNMREFNKEIQNNLKNFEINNKKVVTELEVSFKRKNQVYKKLIFVIMTTNMETNIQKKIISNIFLM